MENSILGNKDLIPKKVYDVCQLLIEWHNNYTTLSHDKDQTQKKGNNKKYITCFRCKKTGQYANECEEELPKTNHERKGTSLLINKEESSDEELGSDDEYYEENEESIKQDTQQDRKNTALDDDKKSDDESYEEDNMFIEDDYKGFAFTQDVDSVG